MRSKLAAAKDEMLRSFEQRTLEGAALGSLKEHQTYLMKLIDEKNLELIDKEEKNRRFEAQLEDQRRRNGDL